MKLEENKIMMSKYNVSCDQTSGTVDSWRTGRGRIDRWRIVKRVDNGDVEVWSANNDVRGDGGGYPIYRVWPNPDDVYTK